MVASRDACSCAECGVVCRGLFPGCASVWAAGPRRIALTRPAREAGNLLSLPTPSPAPTPSAAPSPSPTPSVAATSEIAAAGTALEQSEVRALRIDMQMLMSKVDKLRQAVAPGEQMVKAAKEIGAVATALPDQLKEAVSSALEIQRRSMFKAFAEMEGKIVEDIAQVQDKVRQSPQAPGGQPVSVADLDSRFQWLVEAVSQRFVTLGNELAFIERLLADEHAVNVSTNGGVTNGGVTNGGVTNGAVPNGAWANGDKLSPPKGDEARA